MTLLRSFGILMCKRQVLRLLIEGQDDFLTEARDTLRAGLSSAAWITVDDTGARRARECRPTPSVSHPSRRLRLVDA